MILRNGILIENNKFGCIIMQNNGAMEIFDFTHVQTAETRRYFCWLYEATVLLCLFFEFVLHLVHLAAPDYSCYSKAAYSTSFPGGAQCYML